MGEAVATGKVIKLVRIWMV